MKKTIIIMSLFLGSLFAETTSSINVSHPLVVSYGMGTINDSLMSYVEAGLGGSKVGVGLGKISGKAGQTTGIAIMAMGMYTWESPVDQFVEADVIDENIFLQEELYFGGEAVISVPMQGSPVRFAFGAYRLLDTDTTAVAEPDDFVYSFSVGFGF